MTSNKKYISVGTKLDWRTAELWSEFCLKNQSTSSEMLREVIMEIVGHTEKMAA